MNRKYKKNSWVGKIYKWTIGNHYNTDSCSVKRAVLWEAPIKLLFNHRLFYFSPLGEHIQTWFIWHTAIQIYAIVNWERMKAIAVAENPILLDVLVFFTLPIVGLITALEAILVIAFVGGGIVFVVKEIVARIRGRVIAPVGNRVRIISEPVESYVSEWWDELKNKLCKPVTWVD